MGSKKQDQRAISKINFLTKKLGDHIVVSKLDTVYVFDSLALLDCSPSLQVFSLDIQLCSPALYRVSLFPGSSIQVYCPDLQVCSPALKVCSTALQFCFRVLQACSSAKNRSVEPENITENIESARIRRESQRAEYGSQKGESGSQKGEPERRGGEPGSQKGEPGSRLWIPIGEPVGRSFGFGEPESRGATNNA